MFLTRCPPVLYLGCSSANRSDTEQELAAATLPVAWADSAVSALTELQRRDLPVVLLARSCGAAALQVARDVRRHLVSIAAAGSAITGAVLTRGTASASQYPPRARVREVGRVLGPASHLASLAVRTPVSRVTSTKRVAAALALLVCLVPALGFAQTSDPEGAAAAARMKIGPLALNPTLALTNAGMDDNVFNEADQAVPKRDFTITITPATDLWLRLGRAWLTGTIREDLVYYREYASERSANTLYRAALVVPLNRISLTGGASYLSARERPGFEIDARSQRNDIGFNGSVEVRALTKTFFGIRSDRTKTNFDEGAVFLNSNLQYELNRTVTSAGLTVRHQLTPLTSLTLDVGREQDRFEFSALRDSNSTMIAGGVLFDPVALIKGSASFGYRDFKPLSSDLPGYKGTTASVNLSYVAFDSTKLDVTASRDVGYSFEVNQPYYVQTGATGSISQQVYGPLDVVGRIGIQLLDYHDRAGVVVAISNRIDIVHSWGVGAGYRLGQDIRMGVNIDHSNRTSSIRPYSGLRYGISVTYGS